MARRRRRGSGSVTQRADGLWVGQVSAGWVDGKRRRLSFSSRTKGDVDFWIRETVRSLDFGEEPGNARRTVADFLEDWLAHVSPTVRPTTARGYAIHVHKWIVPEVGELALVRLRRVDVRRVRDSVTRAGKSPRTAQSVLVTLRMALRAAEDEGAIERSPAATVKAPTLGTREPVTMSPDEARAILRAFAGHRLGPAVTVALTTGLRLGEQLGLRWADWHGQRATISGAVRPLPRDDGTGYVLTRVATKTRRSVRTVELSAMAQAALSEQRRFQAEGTISEYVFAKPDGTMADPRLVTRAFQRHLALSGLPRLRWHDLRHGFATLQLANGVPLRVISESLGHASIGITANVYAHVLPSLQRDAVSRLDDLLSER